MRFDGWFLNVKLNVSESIITDIILVMCVCVYVCIYSSILTYIQMNISDLKNISLTHRPYPYTDRCGQYVVYTE